MARQQKKGIQYFSMDTDIYADRKIRRIQSQCGPLAMSVITMILCHIYGEEGYFALADDDFVFDVADELGVDTQLVRGVVAACVDGGFFDKAMHQQHGILTSARVQRNYIAATRRRASRDMNAAYVLIAQGESDGNPTAVDGNPTAVDGNPTAVDGNPTAVDGESTQSKVNKSKSNKRKAKETKPHQDGADAREVGPFVFMTDEQYSDLVSRYGQSGTDCMIEKLGNYKAQSGKEYRSDYHAIRGWVVRRYNEEQAQAAQKQAKHETFERGTENYDHLFEDLFEDDG